MVEQMAWQASVTRYRYLQGNDGFQFLRMEFVRLSEPVLWWLTKCLFPDRRASWLFGLSLVAGALHSSFAFSNGLNESERCSIGMRTFENHLEGFRLEVENCWVESGERSEAWVV